LSRARAVEVRAAPLSCAAPAPRREIAQTVRVRPRHYPRARGPAVATRRRGGPMSRLPRYDEYRRELLAQHAVLRDLIGQVRERAEEALLAPISPHALQATLSAL